MHGKTLILQRRSGVIDEIWDYITVSVRVDGKRSVFHYIDGYDEIGRQTTVLFNKAVGLKNLSEVADTAYQFIKERNLDLNRISRDELLVTAAKIFFLPQDALDFIKEWDRVTSVESRLRE